MFYLLSREGRDLDLHAKVSPGCGAINESKPQPSSLSSPSPVNVWHSWAEGWKNNTKPKISPTEPPPVWIFLCVWFFFPFPFFFFLNEKKKNKTAFWRPREEFAVSRKAHFILFVCLPGVLVCFLLILAEGGSLWSENVKLLPLPCWTQLRRMGCPGCVLLKSRINNWNMESFCPAQCCVQPLLVDWRAGNAVSSNRLPVVLLLENRFNEAFVLLLPFS